VRHGRPRRTRIVVIALATLALLLAVSAAGAKHATPAVPVYVTRLEGVVSPVMAEALDRALARAESAHSPALVIELDTPGGLETSMRDMVKRMLAAKVPVIVWIEPSGGRAASAGVFITMAADVAAMAPGTNIGAATPINMQGPMDSTLARKATNDAAAFARTVAHQRGRNAEWAEDAVRHAVAASETEAVDLHIVDFVSGSLSDVLERADGRSWRRGDDTQTIATRGRPTERIDAGFRMRMLALLADPNVAYILMLLGFYGILFELQNPGAILPGVVGGIALILAFFALSTLPVNSAGVALIVLGIVFFIAEIKVTSHGVLAAGGILAMLLGSLLLFHGDTRVSFGVIAGGTVVTAAFFLWIVGAGIRAQRGKVQTGVPAMIGLPGEVIERVAPTGRVRIGGVLWNARSVTPLEIGTDVEIVAVDGLTVEVRPLRKEASS